MYLIQIENMIRRSFDQLFPLGQDHRLQNIDHLCDICHLDTVAVFVEKIQVDPCDQCVTHGILLIQKSRIGTRLHIIPGSPLVNYHADFLLRVILVHNCPMSLNQLLHLQSCLQGTVPVCLVKLQGRPLLLPVAGRQCIIM